MWQTADHRPLVRTVIPHSVIGGLPFRQRALRRALEHTVKARAEWWITQPGTSARHFRPLQP
jgi:allantoinase